MLPIRSDGPPDPAPDPATGGSAFKSRSLMGRLFAPRPAKLAGRALFERAAAQARTRGLYSVKAMTDATLGVYRSMLEDRR